MSTLAIAIGLATMTWAAWDYLEYHARRCQEDARWSEAIDALIANMRAILDAWPDDRDELTIDEMNALVTSVAKDPTE